MIKVGQVRKNNTNGEEFVFVVVDTCNDEFICISNYNMIYKETDKNIENNSSIIAEYQTKEEALFSKEFRDSKFLIVDDDSTIVPNKKKIVSKITIQ